MLESSYRVTTGILSKEYGSPQQKNPDTGLSIYDEGSRYGTWSFETTLADLGVAGIEQGEIVSYKNEVNFILYASDTTPEISPKIPSRREVKRCERNRSAFRCVSIFVPKQFLPEEFQDKIKEPQRIMHTGLCVKAKRGHSTCDELETSEL